MANDEATTLDEKEFQRGSESAWRTLLLLALTNLDEESHTAEAWRAERALTVAALREVCEEFGDNEWEPDLTLADVVEKHLARRLRVERDRRDGE